ncbi:helix-turn-helix transcriptional regulator [Crossiella cryophila]|uniref:DNA-binding NarL/FixJ family response regulator n=1 Tax=Crossiella cryophila TaxID=43355 RepID=A0A7W7CA97_9PSEU|nr:LuxR C-terminal-related transcriptional regulator [Crossiella cryophila]MBB4677426.1 DNA-binding NarL/FixJ family response regulator [Crossiella cryophila]
MGLSLSNEVVEGTSLKSVVPVSVGGNSAFLRAAEPRDRITVAVRVDDQLLAAEMIPQLALSPDLHLLAAGESAPADVVLVLGNSVTDELIDDLAAMADRAENFAQRVVLVAGPLRERHLSRIFGVGVVSILPRRDISARLVTRALIATRAGGAVLPEKLTRWLVDEARGFQSDLLAKQGLTSGGLTAREVEVLRLIAQGEDTAHIATQLSYSERTIKKIMQDLLSRLELRNRAHAVSYALRVGAI